MAKDGCSEERQLVSAAHLLEVWAGPRGKRKYMNYETLTTFTARDAKTRFGEVLDEALGHPVGITRHDRLTAYVVSKRDFDSLVSRVQELEDQLWLARADAARKEGFASADEVQALLSDSRNSPTNEPKTANNQTGPEGLRKA
jgi:prevent-host-death family protein